MGASVWTSRAPRLVCTGITTIEPTGGVMTHPNVTTFPILRTACTSCTSAWNISFLAWVAIRVIALLSGDECEDDEDDKSMGREEGVC
jgi:hypothetical protein